MRGKMTMPEIREELYVLAARCGEPRLKFLADELIRRSTHRRAPTKARSVTPTICKAVRRIHALYPFMHQRELGRLFRIDGGRVNEILNGFRDGTTYEQHLGFP